MVAVFYVVYSGFVIWPEVRFHSPEFLAIMYLQIGMFGVIMACLVLSFCCGKLYLMKYLLFFQSVQITLTCLKTYPYQCTFNAEEGFYRNFRALKEIMSMFTVIFAILNSFLLNSLIDNKKVYISLISVIFSLLLFVILYTTFDFEEMAFITKSTFGLSIVMMLLIIPIFTIVTNNINREVDNQLKISYIKEKQYKKMFDCLQEGVIVIQKK